MALMLYFPFNPQLGPATCRAKYVSAFFFSDWDLATVVIRLHFGKNDGLNCGSQCSQQISKCLLFLTIKVVSRAGKHRILGATW